MPAESRRLPAGWNDTPTAGAKGPRSERTSCPELRSHSVSVWRPRAELALLATALHHFRDKVFREDQKFIDGLLDTRLGRPEARIRLFRCVPVYRGPKPTPGLNWAALRTITPRRPGLMSLRGTNLLHRIDRRFRRLMSRLDAPRSRVTVHSHGPVSEGVRGGRVRAVVGCSVSTGGGRGRRTGARRAPYWPTPKPSRTPLYGRFGPVCDTGPSVVGRAVTPLGL